MNILKAVNLRKIYGQGETEVRALDGINPVSYTHLDVYKRQVIQSAIENRRIIRFKYYAPSGESNRRVEPYYLVFQWSSWYVWGWCLERKDYRLFKLNRMDCVVETDRGFLCRDVPMPDLSNEKIFPGGIKVKALFTPNMKWRLVEEFGPNCFTETDDGRLLFSADYTDCLLYTSRCV